jgi:hypothetical protein
VARTRLITRHFCRSEFEYLLDESFQELVALFDDFKRAFIAASDLSSELMDVSGLLKFQETMAATAINMAVRRYLKLRRMQAMFSSSTLIAMAYRRRVLFGTKEDLAGKIEAIVAIVMGKPRKLLHGSASVIALAYRRRLLSYASHEVKMERIHRIAHNNRHPDARWTRVASPEAVTSEPMNGPAGPAANLARQAALHGKALVTAGISAGTAAAGVAGAAGAAAVGAVSVVGRTAQGVVAKTAHPAPCAGVARISKATFAAGGVESVEAVEVSPRAAARRIRLDALPPR